GTVEVKKDRVEYWLGTGAQTSGTVHNFLVDQGIVKGKKINVLPKKAPTKKRNAPDEPEPTPAPVAAPAETAAEETPEPAAESTAAEPATEETPNETTNEEEKKES